MLKRQIKMSILRHKCIYRNLAFEKIRILTQWGKEALMKNVQYVTFGEKNSSPTVFFTLFILIIFKKPIRLKEENMSRF